MISRRRLILFTQYNKSYPTSVPNFKILGAVVPEKSLTQISLCITLEWETEKWKKKAKSNHNLGFLSHNILGPVLLERKKNGQIKGMMSRRRLILIYTLQQVIPNICTKFQNPRRSSSWEIFDTNFSMYYTGVRDGKKKNWKKMVKINFSILVFCPTIYLATLKVYKKFEDCLS